MTTSRANTVLFWVLMFGCLHGLLVAGWRTVDYYVRLDMPAYSHWFLAKFLGYVGLLLIGVWVFQLLRQYRRSGFFDLTSVRTVRRVGWALVAVSVCNSAFNVLRDLVVMPQATHLPPTSSLAFRFVWDYLFESPAFLFLSLLVFGLAGFMHRAIVLKNDNESII